eukprot:GCRY01002906.1.p1 GENE.GCRY01002906.1~~GCRY01002906.1.p1  ORF type:complete len:851 (-),score=173.96 GCRY01002906.1:43-2595(-)
MNQNESGFLSFEKQNNPFIKCLLSEENTDVAEAIIAYNATVLAPSSIHLDSLTINRFFILSHIIVFAPNSGQFVTLTGARGSLTGDYIYMLAPPAQDQGEYVDVEGLLRSPFLPDSNASNTKTIHILRSDVLEVADFSRDIHSVPMILLSETVLFPFQINDLRLRTEKGQLRESLEKTQAQESVDLLDLFGLDDNENKDFVKVEADSKESSLQQLSDLKFTDVGGKPFSSEFDVFTLFGSKPANTTMDNTVSSSSDRSLQQRNNTDVGSSPQPVGGNADYQEETVKMPKAQSEVFPSHSSALEATFQQPKDSVNDVLEASETESSPSHSFSPPPPSSSVTQTPCHDKEAPSFVETLPESSPNSPAPATTICADSTTPSSSPCEADHASKITGSMSSTETTANAVNPPPADIMPSTNAGKMAADVPPSAPLNANQKSSAESTTQPEHSDSNEDTHSTAPKSGLNITAHYPKPLRFSEFLEQMKHPSAQPFVKAITKFVAEFLDKPPIEPETQSKIVRAFLNKTCDGILQLPVFGNEDEGEHVAEGLEKYVMSKIYSRAFAPNASEDFPHDEALAAKIDFVHWIEPHHLDIPPITGHACERLQQAQDELRKMDTFKSPRDKTMCIINSSIHLFGLLSSLYKGEQVGADEFLPVLIYTIIRTNPPKLFSNLEYITRFRHPAFLCSETGYYLTQVYSAVHFIEHIDASKLSIQKSEYEEHIRREFDVHSTHVSFTPEEEAEAEKGTPPPSTLDTLFEPYQQKAEEKEGESISTAEPSPQTPERNDTEGAGMKDGSIVDRLRHISAEELTMRDIPALLALFKDLVQENEALSLQVRNLKEKMGSNEDSSHLHQGE